MKPVEILRNTQILFDLERAWLESFPGIPGGHEEGGFIVVDGTENLSIVRWDKGSQNEIILPPHKNCFVNGKDIIASFHTHPNTGPDFQQEPSLTDVRAVREDFDLKGGIYLGEFIISEENVYLIEPSGEFGIIGNTNEIF